MNKKKNEKLKRVQCGDGVVKNIFYVQDLFRVVKKGSLPIHSSIVFTVNCV